jgi:hypothetical protein
MGDVTAALSINPNWRILTWTASDYQNFPRHIQHHRGHAAAFTATPGGHAKPLLLHCWDHTASFPTTSTAVTAAGSTSCLGTAPSSPPSPLPVPRCPAVTTVPGNRVVHLQQVVKTLSLSLSLSLSLCQFHFVAFGCLPMILLRS